MKFKTIIAVSIFAGFTQSAMASPSINDMQGCQAVLDFIDDKLDPANAKYDATKVTIVRKGMQAYNDYIQAEIVSPGLLEFNKGDAAKAAEMQKQVDAYKATITKDLHKRFPQDRVFTDHAISVNNCAKIAVPAGADLEALKAGLLTLLDLAKQN